MNAEKNGSQKLNDDEESHLYADVNSAVMRYDDEKKATVVYSLVKLDQSKKKVKLDDTSLLLIFTRRTFATVDVIDRRPMSWAIMFFDFLLCSK
jgi:hypothetical protein